MPAEQGRRFEDWPKEGLALVHHALRMYSAHYPGHLAAVEREQYTRLTDLAWDEITARAYTETCGA